jgi:hypothetical protein
MPPHPQDNQGTRVIDNPVAVYEEFRHLRTVFTATEFDKRIDDFLARHCPEPNCNHDIHICLRCLAMRDEIIALFVLERLLVR